MIKNVFTIGIFVSGVAVLGGTGCTHQPLNLFAGPAVKLRLVPKVGEKERTRYISHSVTETFVEGNLERKKREDVEFVVEAVTRDVDAVNKRINLELTTVEQDGAAELRDFAMPALNEKLKMTIDDRTNVYDAGKYPPGTIFYVPSLSLPDRAVKPGDTWDMRAEWVTFQGVPLKMELVSVLKDIVKCGESQCADIDVSGDVEILDAGKEIRFRSELNGRYLLAIDRGLVMWSLVRSDQEISTASDRVNVTNCLLSRLESPKEFTWSAITATDCAPDAKIPEKLMSALKMAIVPTGKE